MAWRCVWTVSPGRLPARPLLKSSVGFRPPSHLYLDIRKRNNTRDREKMNMDSAVKLRDKSKKKKTATKRESSFRFFFVFFFASSSLCCEMSHNINTKHPLPVISMSFCCQVTLLAPSAQWWVGLGSGEVSAKHKPRPWGVVGWWRSCRAAERMED